MKRKFLITLLVAVSAVCCAIGLTACTKTVDGTKIKKDGDGYVVTGLDDDSITELVIPSEYNGKPVTAIGEYAFSDCTNLTSVTIPDSVTSIGEYAFGWCTSLTSVIISDSVTSIGNGAFFECTSLTSITIPDSVTSIGRSAFYQCKSLESVTIPDSVTSIGSSAFYQCKSLESIALPAGITKIDNYTFYECYNLKSITIPDGVTEIGDDAFGNDTSLTSITIPDGVTEIGDYAFGSCCPINLTAPAFVFDYIITKYLQNVVITSGTSVDEHTFKYSYDLTSITVADGNTKYHSAGNCLIETESKTLIAGCNTSVIPDDGSVTSIGDGAFYGRKSLASITIPDGVTKIGDDAFYECYHLTSITIPDSVTSIGSSAFYQCESLETINYNGTVLQWKAIKEDSRWNEYTGNYTVQCTDGKLNKKGNVIG